MQVDQKHLSRFWSKVEKTPTCWHWTASLNDKGYGNFTINRKHILAHRLLFMVTHGVVLSTQQFVCHSCDNPACVRPEHLFLGDNQTNMTDMKLKGRGSNQKKKTCRRGHVYDTENTIWRNVKGKLWRHCRECRRISALHIWRKKHGQNIKYRSKG